MPHELTRVSRQFLALSRRAGVSSLFIYFFFFYDLHTWASWVVDKAYTRRSLRFCHNLHMWTPCVFVTIYTRELFLRFCHDLYTWTLYVFGHDLHTSALCVFVTTYTCELPAFLSRSTHVSSLRFCHDVHTWTPFVFVTTYTRQLFAFLSRPTHVNSLLAMHANVITSSPPRPMPWSGKNCHLYRKGIPYGARFISSYFVLCWRSYWTDWSHKQRKSSLKNRRASEQEGAPQSRSATCKSFASTISSTSKTSTMSS